MRRAHLFVPESARHAIIGLDAMRSVLKALLVGTLLALAPAGRQRQQGA